MQKQKPIKIEITEEEILLRIEQIESLDCDDGLRSFLIDALRTLIILDKLISLKETTIARLRKIFNKQIEKVKKDKKDKKPGDNKGGRKKGQGNNPASAFANAEIENHELEDHLKPGKACPDCLKGRLYAVDPGIFIKITGSPSFVAKKHITEKSRCNLCGKIFEAKCSAKTGGKYDITVNSLIAIHHFQACMPYYRMERIQRYLLTPMPRSVQCSLIEELANKLLPVWKASLEQAREADLAYSDDTKARVVSIIRDNMKLSKKDKKGIFTTGIIAQSAIAKICLFFTGRMHSGNNLAELLKDRKSTLVPQIMSDAHAVNNPGEDIEYIKLLCLVHARRNFFSIKDAFKEECDYALSVIAKIYENDSYCKDNNLSPKERLDYHKTHSSKIMKEFKLWCHDCLDNKKAEPNSSLGKAMSYIIKHWEGLTGFLEHEGAPLDNNKLESLLRTPVLNRKNWLFYHNETTALLGDIILSTLKTCEVNNVDPFKYLNYVQSNYELIKNEPHLHLPWKVDL